MLFSVKLPPFSTLHTSKYGLHLTLFRTGGRIKSDPLGLLLVVHDVTDSSIVTF